MKQQAQLKRSLGLWSSLALVIGTVIGSGIFFKQASVLDYSHSTTMALLAWIFGGLLTLASGLTIAEIGAQMPHTGGLYFYMEKIYGKLWGFLSGWMQIIVYGPAMIAALGSYLAVLLVAFFDLPNSWEHPLAIFSVALITIFNLLSNRYGAAFQILTTIGKFIPIIAIIIFGLFFGDHNALGNVVSQSSSSSTGNFGVAILATLFAYDGWILLANMGGEIKNPQKLLPLAIIWGLVIVLVAYILVTWGIFSVLTADQIHQFGEDAAPHFASIAFGNLGGKLLNIGIIISIAGCLNGKIMSFPRIMYAMAKNDDLPFSKKLAYVNAKTHSPMIATLVIFCIAVLMILSVNADRLTELCIFTVYCFYVIAFCGLFKLRLVHPQRPRPFSVPLYPWIPLIAIGGAIFVLISEIISDTQGVLVSLIIVIVGIPIYFYKNRPER
ncbi:amino acid permease-associated protein [Liquorilactobacillus aquaticus DSM 21051]|uniref:Amino acid permease-associated protein n=1 Tax=Liquorilactobacillus aquaticus DSM 21051 TaxID=1423725 RepID=A0A0R2D0T6_9LACO|nr:amino acid permease [Liquorilactobacillus aquaticus]KRM95508.1 amino acid permease-associated protein [Liquorilactobacillus aquaticus DSM 21051]